MARRMGGPSAADRCLSYIVLFFAGRFFFAKMSKSSPPLIYQAGWSRRVRPATFGRMLKVYCQIDFAKNRCLFTGGSMPVPIVLFFRRA